MSPPCTVLRTNIFFFLTAWVFSAQAQSFDTTAFYKHLKDENLLMEQAAFASKLLANVSADPIQKDTLLLDLSVAYFKLKMPDSCASGLQRISAEKKLPERKKQLYFSSMLLMGQFEEVEKNLAVNSLVFASDMKTSLVILKRGDFRSDTAVKNISPFALDLRKRYVDSPKHSPFLAGAFSAVLPGAGKWYIGHKRQALTSFIAHVFFAAQAIESYSKAGPASPQFIITAGLFGVFYSGNIWGSVVAAKKKKRDHLNELDYEILDHYYTELSKLSR